MKTFGIIGYGKLGSALAKKLSELNLLSWICSASGKISPEINVQSYRSVEDISNFPDIIFITKSDSEIQTSAIALAKKAGKKLDGKIIIHCSGIYTNGILNRCSDEGGITAVAHPYQTFYRYTDDVFNDIAWTVEAGNNFKVIEEIINLLGGRAFDISSIPGFSKELYHASAVIASNYMNTISSLAADTARLSGINPSDFLPQILRTTLENIISSMQGANDLALTGPIARADVAALIKQIKELKSHANICTEYCRIGLSTLETAYRRALITEAKYLEMKKIFNENI